MVGGVVGGMVGGMVGGNGRRQWSEACTVGFGPHRAHAHGWSGMVGLGCTVGSGCTVEMHGWDAWLGCMIGMHGGEVHGWTGTHGWSLTAPRAPGAAAASPHHLQAEGDDTSWQRPGDAATAACVPVCDGSDDADRAAARAVPRETERPQDVANSSHRPQNGHDEPSWQHSTWATGGAAECLALFNVHTPVGIPTRRRAGPHSVERQRAFAVRTRGLTRRHWR